MPTWKSVWTATSATAIIEEFSGFRIVPRAIAVSIRRWPGAGASGALFAALSGAAMSKTISVRRVSEYGGGGAQAAEAFPQAAALEPQSARSGHPVWGLG